MRADVPTPGSQWPPDMVIHVETPGHLLSLLFVRHAWGLARAVNIPELDPAPEAGASIMPADADLEEWSSRWERLWREAWAWFASDAPVPPRWESTYGRGGIDQAALDDWERAIHPPSPGSPEHECVDALVPVWRSGIDSIVVLPYRGYYLQRLSHRHLAVSKATRDDPTLYRRALATIR